MKKQFIILAVVLALFTIITIKSASLLTCENPNSSYVIFNSFNKKNVKIGCTQLTDTSNKTLESDNLFGVVNFFDNLVLYGDTSILEINKESGQYTEYNMSHEEGIIQNVIQWDKDKIYLVNGALVEDNYESYMMINDLKVPSQGGLMVSGVKRDDYIYVTERKVPSSRRVLYKYNLEGELVETFSEQATFGDVNPILDNQNNIVFQYGDSFILIDEHDNEMVFPVVLTEPIIGESTLFLIHDSVLGISQNGIIFKVSQESNKIEYLNTIPVGSDAIYTEPEMVFNCYSTSSNNLLCEYNSIENMINVSAFSEYNLSTNEFGIYMPFSFDTNERYYPAHLIKVD